MDSELFAEKLEKVISTINRDREVNAAKIALDLSALARRRVINSGQRADGKQFSDYSDKDVPYYFYYGTFPDQRVDKARDSMGNVFSYKDWRDFLGRPTNIKNFSLTGEMWKDSHLQ